MIYYQFVAGAYQVEAKNHTASIGFFIRLTADRRRLKVWKSAGYQVMTLYTNDWGGQLTTTRQDEWNPYADRPSGKNPERDIAQFRALAGRGQTRAGVLRRPGGEVPAGAARRPWLSVPPDPPPPE